MPKIFSSSAKRFLFRQCSSLIVTIGTPLLPKFVGRGPMSFVTRSLRGLPSHALAPCNIEAEHPDELTRHPIDLAPVAITDAVRDQQVAMDELLAVIES
jgi:hypothetical protein